MKIATRLARRRIILQVYAPPARAILNEDCCDDCGNGIAQRIDLRIQLPGEGGAFPILALREGATEQTGAVMEGPYFSLGGECI